MLTDIASRSSFSSCALNPRALGTSTLAISSSPPESAAPALATHATEIQARFTVQEILPALHASSWVQSRPLSDDGFSDSLATLALSPGLRLGLHAGGLKISQRGLDSLGLSIQAAWDLAALNLERAARTPAGLEFSTRCVTARFGSRIPAGVEIKVRGADAQAWLAHPQTFTILHRHLLRILRAQQLVYLLPDAHSLLAFIDLPARALSSLAESLPSPCPYPLLWAHGFPQEFRT